MRAACCGAVKTFFSCRLRRQRRQRRSLRLFVWPRRWGLENQRRFSFRLGGEGASRPTCVFRHRGWAGLSRGCCRSCTAEPCGCGISGACGGAHRSLSLLFGGTTQLEPPGLFARRWALVGPCTGVHGVEYNDAQHIRSLQESWVISISGQHFPDTTCGEFA